jgi:hypothetical protein
LLRCPAATAAAWEGNTIHPENSGFTPKEIDTTSGFSPKHLRASNASNDLQFPVVLQRNMYLLIQSSATHINVQLQVT